MTTANPDEPADALGVVAVQDEIIRDLVAKWRSATEQLREADDVDVRWQRGSAVKLLLQHLAVRESAKEALAGRLREVDRDDLAAAVDGDGVGRRTAIDRLDELARGHEAITLNTPDIDGVVEGLAAIFDPERPEEIETLLPEAAGILGAPGERGLPTARHVRTHSVTHPSPVPRWYDRIGPIKAIRALYDHLRASPSGGTSPAVDEGREHLPGPRP
jgi:hypothetical protein